MLRRWLIRALALTLLTLCVAAWVGSYWQWAGINRHYHGYRVAVNCGAGLIYSQVLDHEPFVMSEWGWGHGVPFPEYIRTTTAGEEYGFAGFGYQFTPGATHDSWDMKVPLWAPVLLAAGLLWLLWRKTRPPYHGKGFPIEPAAPPK